MMASTVSSSSCSSIRSRSAADSGASLAKSSASIICVNRIRLRVLPPVQPQLCERLALVDADLTTLRQLEARDERHHAVQPIAERLHQPPKLDTGHSRQRLHDERDLLLERYRALPYPVIFRALR